MTPVGDMPLHEARLQRDLDLIIDTLSGMKPRALILYGGYGRDEGSWVISQEGDVRPYNDYDVLVITERPIPDEEVQPLRKELAAQIGIRWVDIGQKTPVQLARLKPSIFNYDLKHASKVIWGDPTVLDLIPDMDPARLPLKDTETLFFTRLWTFLGSLDRDGFKRTLQGEESRFFRNQMTKAVLAVVDGWLLTKEAYHFSYREKVKRIIALQQHRPKFVELCQWALDERFTPQAPTMEPDQVVALYRQVFELYFNDMLLALSRYYRRDVRTPEQILRAMCWAPRALVWRVGMILLRRTWSYETTLKLRAAQLYIAMAYRQGQIDEALLAKGNRFLKQLDPQTPAPETWDDARVHVARLRVNE
ncbi:MAG: nucleotidyltransferase domain-containing protein [Candidatus Marinimicrobia bacterium]|nr:nucleotidyltransferase domain-containing protein [Candidatus Neomarinimicrobiota bacterium]